MNWIHWISLTIALFIGIPLIISCIYLIIKINKKDTLQIKENSDESPFIKMEEYYEFHSDRLKKVKNAKEKIHVAKINLEEKIKTIKRDIDTNIKLGAEALKRGNQAYADHASMRVSAQKGLLDCLLPQLEALFKNKQYLETLYTGYETVVKQIRVNIDIEKQRYDILKEVNEANEYASELSGNIGEQKILYQTSIRQLEEVTSLFTVKIEDFQRKTNPLLEQIQFETFMQREDGLELIRNYSRELKQLQGV